MSVIQQLRQLMPNRALTEAEARSIAERQAARFLQLHDIREPHVPLTLVADLPKVQVESRRSIPVAGSTHWTGGAWQIVVNGDDAAVRQRFTLGHEFKHVLDHPVVDVAYPTLDRHSSDERQEDICDYFSACLLMPRSWVKHYWTTGYQQIDELAQLFGVSRAAMRYRLTDIGLVEPSLRRRHYFRTALSWTTDVRHQEVPIA